MATMSLNKINRTALAEVRTHKKILMIMNIMLAAATLLLWMVDNEGLMVLGMFLFCVGGAIGIIASVNVFREMTNSQLCDVKLSLPMSNLERYFSRLLTLAYIHIFPMMGYGFLGLAGMYISNGFSEGFLDNIRIPDVVAIYMIALGITLFIDSVTVFCTTCCGALAESVYFSIIAMGCISVAPGVMYYQIANAFGGMSDVPEFIKYWTFSAVLAAEDANSPSDMILPQIISILISCALFAAAYLTFKRRDASSVGDPIAVKLFYEIIMVLGVFTVYSAFICSSAMKVGVILTAIIYLVINIIVIRAKINPKRIAFWLLKLAATSAVFMAIVFAGFLTDGFGIYDYMPIRSMANNDIRIYTYVLDDVRGTVDYEVQTDFGELSDEQMREVIKICRKYGYTAKTADRFFGLVSGDAYGRVRDGDTDSSSFNMVKVESCKQYKRMEDGSEYTLERTTLDQHILMSNEDVEQLFAELKELGIPVNISYTDYNDYDNYDDGVYEEEVPMSEEPAPAY
ncbi:MAG: hypothetical protein K6C68_07805 [Ruminococcus sp.]|nr:hypothetical protein [Ruminococcus sp.]